MNQAPKPARLARFGVFEFDFYTRELRKNGMKIKLAGQPVEVLAMLLEHPGELVTREELQKRLWPNDTIVDFDYGINAAINRLREALNDSADNPRFVETLHRRGYRFIAPVETLKRAVSEGESFQRNVPAPSAPQPEHAAPESPVERKELTGQTVSHYRIFEKLGGGGMGVVYKAEDTRLERLVAVKLLPVELTRDQQSVERFQREARAASALNHPHICTVHDIGEHTGQPFIVMEYLEGQTLKQRLSVAPVFDRRPGAHRAPLQLDEMLDLAMQVADALDAAHQKGIIHRDVKPANIFVTNRGDAKILDFGLAKLTEPLTPSPSSQGRGEKASTSQPSPLGRGCPDQIGTGEGSVNAPTASVEPESLTALGVAMGTAPYMSPEQLRGETVDARTDIFAFGAVLYEMATGRRAFEAESHAGLAAAILEHEPPATSTLRPDLPPALEHVVNRCLAKNPNERWQTARDLQLELKWIRETVAPVSPPATVVSDRPAAMRTSPPQQRRPVIALAAALILAIGGAIGYRYSRRPPTTKPSAPPMKAVPFTTFPGQTADPSFSADGNQIAFAWNGKNEDNWDIYVKMIGAESVLRLTTNPAIDLSPAWSPDGRYIAFCRHTESEDGIFLVPALGGPERKLYPPHMGAAWRVGGLGWSPDGKYLAFSEKLPGEELRRVSVLSVETLNKRVVTSPVPPVNLGDIRPRFSPDGKTLAFGRGFTAQGFDAWLVPAAGGQPQQVTRGNEGFGGFTWTPDSAHLIYAGSWGGTWGLWRIPLAGGEPERLPVGGEYALAPALSRDGQRLAYVEASEDVNIWRYEVPRGSERPKPPTKLIASTVPEMAQQFSPDGKRIVFASGRSGNSSEIWVADSDGSNPVQLTNFEGPMAGTPRWSPDGRQVVFDCNAGDNEDIYTVSVEGGPPRRLTSEKSQEVTPSWSRDGKWVYFASDRTGAWQTWKMPAEGGRAVQVTRGGGFAAFESLDGKTLYYAKGLTVPGLWKVPVEGGEETLVLEQLAASLWGYWGLTRDGIYFYDAATRAIEFFSFATRKTTQIAKPEKEPHRSNPGFSVSPDGQWILYAQLDVIASHIMLVVNFRW